MSAIRPSLGSSSHRRRVAKITKKSNRSMRKLATEIASTTCLSSANKSGVFGDHHVSRHCTTMTIEISEGWKITVPRLFESFI